MDNTRQNAAPESEAGRRYAIVPIRGKTILPGYGAAIDLSGEKSVAAANFIAEGRCDFIAALVGASPTDPAEEEFSEYGTVCRPRQIIRQPSGAVRILVDPLIRAHILGFEQNEPFPMVRAETIEDVHSDPTLERALFLSLKERLLDFIKSELKNIDVPALERIDMLSAFLDAAAYILPIREDDRQKMLAEADVLRRYSLFENIFAETREIVRIQRKVNSEVRGNIDKNQREYFIREQIRALHGELGDADEKDELAERVKKRNMPKAAEEKCLKELSRLDRMSSSSPEFSVIHTYIDWMLELPFNERTVDEPSLAKAREVLEEDHYGIKKVKERILEYLAVLQLTKKIRGPVLCFVGPPGVGKTSVARSVARALGRKFVRMSLGGVRDEAEIRGHRRTYVGALPGRVIAGMRDAGTVNPVFLFDEIDKMSRDLSGDPASALLEVLDPEQNGAFRDRYLDIDYDLSDVLFITTANTLETIPSALLDRMEVIELTSYTPEEKLQIARRYLAPRCAAESGLGEGDIAFTDGALRLIQEGYTREAGVRNLEREIGSVCRKVAVKVAEFGRGEPRTIDEKDVEELLGARRFFRDDAISCDEVGAVNGLAWTAAGGAVLTVEVGLMPGKGELILTGKLGEVMQESAKIALSLVREHAGKYGIDPTAFEKTDIHVHVPEGATPKDGPSAGVTLAAALLSAFTGKKVRADVAMTGEITLRGKVLPIGGLKEKVLAAGRAGVGEVLFPSENLKDWNDLDPEVRGDLKFVPVGTVEEVFREAIRS